MPLIHDCRKYKFFIAFSIILLNVPLVSGFRKQSAGAKGYLSCNSKPAANIRVKLIDKDRGLNPDDDLNAGYTDSNGFFELAGDTTETTNIDPQLKIYHNCNKGLNPCPIKWVITIPDKYIYSGAKPKKYFDLGHVNLEVEIDGQSFDCIH